MLLKIIKAMFIVYQMSFIKRLQCLLDSCLKGDITNDIKTCINSSIMRFQRVSEGNILFFHIQM